MVMGEDAMRLPLDSDELMRGGEGEEGRGGGGAGRAGIILGMRPLVRRVLGVAVLGSGREETLGGVAGEGDRGSVTALLGQSLDDALGDRCDG